jgi:hypothetical protein
MDCKIGSRENKKVFTILTPSYKDMNVENIDPCTIVGISVNEDPTSSYCVVLDFKGQARIGIGDIKQVFKKFSQKLKKYNMYIHMYKSLFTDLRTIFIFFIYFCIWNDISLSLLLYILLQKDTPPIMHLTPFRICMQIRKWT